MTRLALYALAQIVTVALLILGASIVASLVELVLIGGKP